MESSKKGFTFAPLSASKNEAEANAKSSNDYDRTTFFENIEQLSLIHSIRVISNNTFGI
ncbi:hypothetical protein [Alistipes shahii]